MYGYKPRFGYFRQNVRVKKDEHIRNPVNYLIKRHGVPKKYAEQFLSNPAMSDYWKKDSAGKYMLKETLDSIAYGWKHERKDFMSSIKPPISSYMKRKYEEDLFPQFTVPSDMQRDPMFQGWMSKFEETKQRVKGADSATIIKEAKKLRDIYTKELIKKYPNDKAKIEKSAKEMEKDFAKKIRLKELLEIGNKRYYTEKEIEEIEKLSKD